MTLNISAAGSFCCRSQAVRDNLLFMEKWLIPKDLALPPRRPCLRPGGWRDIQPDLSGELYVFTAGEPPAGVSPFAVIRENEGVTVILTRADADEADLVPTTTSRRGSRCGSAPRSPTSA